LGLLLTFCFGSFTYCFAFVVVFLVILPPDVRFASMKQQINSFALPFAMLTGGIFHTFFNQLNFLTPYLIFFMLFFPYCRIQLKDMRLRSFHLWLILYQVAGSLLAYLLLSLFSEELGQGVLICILAPTATAAIVVGGMLGANIALMASYTLFCNLVVAIMAPILFSFVGIQAELYFWTSFWLIFKRVFPLLVLPFVAALLLRKFAPGFNSKIQKMSSVSFYLWIFALAIVSGRIVHFMLDQQKSDYRMAAVLAAAALIICVFQFLFGRFIGRRYGETVSGGQSLGQKNTILAIWMAQTYLNPIAAIAPASYVLWQNLVNSYQLWRKNRKTS
jgi:BASS family bile acid:Na+ symporter